MLAVVEHQQKLAGQERFRQGCRQRPIWLLTHAACTGHTCLRRMTAGRGTTIELLAYAERRGDRSRHDSRLRKRCQVDEPGATREPARQLLRDPECEPRLPDAGRPD